jgi:purine-binding chemotaxis protein CheW
LEADNGLLIFTLSEQRCALALSDVERVIRAVAVTRAPKAPAIVMGLINIRGKVMPVLNICRLLNLPPAEINPSDQIIIARTSRRTVAILANSTVGVMDYKHDDFAAVGDLFPGIEYVKGVVKSKEGIVYIYDLNSFLSLDEEAELERVLPSGRAPSETNGRDV